MLKIIIMLYKKISGSLGRWVRNARKETIIKPELQNNKAFMKFLVSDCISNQEKSVSHRNFNQIFLDPEADRPKDLLEYHFLII